MKHTANWILNAKRTFGTLTVMMRISGFTKATNYSAHTADQFGLRTAIGSAKIALLNVGAIRQTSTMGDALQIFETDTRAVRVFDSISCVREIRPASDCAKETN